MKLPYLAIALALALPNAANCAEGDAAFAVSPESAYSLLSDAIAESKESIVLNIYMLTNRNITEAIALRAQNGVNVTVLMEGETFGGEILAPVKRVLDDLELRFEQMSQGRGKFLVMTSQGGKNKRRFVFDHAKYMVVDNKKVFVSSENITGSAFNPKNFSGGTRGWEIYLENSALAHSLTQIFQSDIDPSAGDVVPYSKAEFKVKDPGNSPLPPRTPRDVQLFPKQKGTVSAASLCASPDSLSCMLQFIRDSKTELSVEHLSLPLYWVDHQKGGAKTNSPVVAELVAAARRGVKVRVLLNDDNSFGDDAGANPDEKNKLTIDWLKAEAARGKLPLEAATFNQKGLEVSYVHNKGMVADGSRVFVSSINGTENAIMNNREMAVAVDSLDAARYFGEVFGFDWSMRVQ